MLKCRDCRCLITLGNLLLCSAVPRLLSAFIPSPLLPYFNLRMCSLNQESLPFYFNKTVGYRVLFGELMVGAMALKLK